jgi:hypothetical protein
VLNLWGLGFGGLGMEDWGMGFGALGLGFAVCTNGVKQRAVLVGFKAGFRTSV